MAKQETKTSETPQERINAVHTAYFNELNTIGTDDQKRLQEIQAEYQREIVEACPPETPADLRAALDAQEAYWKALQSAQEKLQQALLDTQKKALAENRCAAAYKNYTSAMLKVMADAGPEALDANTLAAVGQSFLAVAQTAACTIPQTS